MSRAAAWLLLAVAAAWLPAPTAPQLQVVLEWLVQDGVSTDVASAALRDPTALESALVQAAVSALRAAGLTNLTNESLALELRSLSAEMRSPAPSPAPGPAAAAAAPPEASVWVPLAAACGAAVACLAVVVGLWACGPLAPRRLARGPVLPHRIVLA